MALLDHDTHPAQLLAAAYRWRWDRFRDACL
jgi:hypothetical protein